MGGGEWIRGNYSDYEHATTARSSARSSKTRDQAIKLALQLATGTAITFVCGGVNEGERMRENVEALLRWAGCFPVKKYMKKFKVLVQGAGKVVGK
jgi:hypothetical protein